MRACGITSASVSTAFAYIADVTPPEIRGAAFGLAGKLFADLTHGLGGWIKGRIAYPPLRPLLGGCVVAPYYDAYGNPVAPVAVAPAPAGADRAEDRVGGAGRAHAPATTPANPANPPAVRFVRPTRPDAAAPGESAAKPDAALPPTVTCCVRTTVAVSRSSRRSRRAVIATGS